MVKRRRPIKPLHWGIFIVALCAVCIAVPGCFRSEPDDPDYPGVAGSPMLRRVVTGDGALKMVVPRHWDLEKAASPEVLKISGDGAEFVIESRAAVAGGAAAAERELAAVTPGWRARGFEVKAGTLKVSSAGGIPFYYRRGSKPGDISPTLIFGLLTPEGASSHYYLYSTGLPHSEKMGGDTITTVRSVRKAR